MQEDESGIQQIINSRFHRPKRFLVCLALAAFDVEEERDRKKAKTDDELESLLKSPEIQFQDKLCMAKILLAQLKSARLGSDTRKLVDNRFRELLHDCIPLLTRHEKNTMHDDMILFLEIVMDLIHIEENKTEFSEDSSVSIIKWNELAEKFVNSVISAYLGQLHANQFFRAPNFQESTNDHEDQCNTDYFQIQSSRQVHYFKSIRYRQLTICFLFSFCRKS